ncbi:hypothetical protein [Kitasatospora aureofaciens]|uniref:hypothetical protein n=1 Tax=Kitasatospora aureofaciens TaxID=1894 RepID=UPI0005243CFF|nr:hypothetical protein [Kitasatospora aureofaciens]
MALQRNTRLEGLITELRWSQSGLAAAVRHVAAEMDASAFLTITQPAVSHWVRGGTPSGEGPDIVCEALTRKAGRRVTREDAGFPPPKENTHQTQPEQDSDPLTVLAHLREDMPGTIGRRTILYSTLAATVPGQGWWDHRRERARQRAPLTTLTVTTAHVEALRDAAAYHSRQDQRLGGRAGRGALRYFLSTDVAAYLSGRPATEAVRLALLSAAGHLAYLDGWTSFDAGEQGDAQRGFGLALTLAAEAGDAALAGHILRAQAHQALDLGHRAAALRYADASVDGPRYSAAVPRERALLGVVHGRALAAAGRKQDAMAALRRAERDLGAADTARNEPDRVEFFAEASLAHETGLALRALGDLKGAEEQLQHSARTRAASSARTHAVTLGLLGGVQAQRGHIDEACDTWNTALEAMAGIQSGRTRDIVLSMRSALSPIRARGGHVAAALDARAREVLHAIG